MSKTMSAAAAKSHFGDCLRDVEDGNQILITRYGKPVAALVSSQEWAQLQRLRAAEPNRGLAGLVGLFDDGDELLEGLDVAGQRSAKSQPLADPEDAE